MAIAVHTEFSLTIKGCFIYCLPYKRLRLACSNPCCFIPEIAHYAELYLFTLLTTLVLTVW